MKNRADEIKYEVNVTVQVEVAQKFKQWLLPHIQEMLQFEGFSKADLYSVLEPIDPAYEQIVVLYTLDSAEHLENYLKHFAVHMRKKTQDLFGNHFTASRRIYKSF